MDITDEAAVKNAFAGMELVYYLASETIPSTTWEKPVLEIERNLIPFLKFMDVIGGIGPLQQNFLLSIRRKPGIASSELVKSLGMESEVALAGVISGLSKQLKQLGIEPKQVFQINVNWTGKTKTRKFILDDFFVGAGMEQNWPDAWEAKEKDLDAIDNPRATKRPAKRKSGQR